MNPHQVTKDFEQLLCEYTGSPYAVATNSCTSAILIALAYHIDQKHLFSSKEDRPKVSMPKPGYLSVPQSVIHAGGFPVFRDEEWQGTYQLEPYPVWDSARRFTSNMYIPGQFQCASFHASKNLGIEMGGAVLLDDPVAVAWLRRSRFDGRTPGVAPIDDDYIMVGHHCYPNPSTMAIGILRLYSLPKDISDLPNDDFPSLDTLDLYQL